MTAGPQIAAVGAKGVTRVGRPRAATRRGGLARRLFAAFGVLIALFALAALAVLAALAQIERGLDSIAREEEGMRLALELASAVRDQYAHQAHTIILGNLTHLGFYGEAARHVREVTAEVRAHARLPEEVALVDELGALGQRLDDVFTRRIVPAVLSGEHATVQSEHGRAQLLVTEIQERADRLARSFEAASSELRARVTRLESMVSRAAVVWLVLAPLCAALVAFFMGRSIAGPVAALEAGAARLAGGNLTTRIELERDDELGALAQQFNAMTTSLREHQERLVQSEKLAGIGRLAAGVAHGINNPLGVILGYARVLRRQASGPMADDLRIIEDEVQRAQGIVEGLLDLSRPAHLRLAAVELAELCTEVRERWCEHRTGGAEIAVAGAVTARGDAAKLRQIVWNLVKNAAEAAGEGGHVRVDLDEVDGEAHVRVCDDGGGLPEGARERLFEPFFTTKPSGTGLGLAVSRALARAHGGELEAASGPLRGACLLLRLPQARAGAEGGA